MLQVKSLSFDYYDQPLFEAVNFTLNEGVLLHLRGSNGAGKTTLLRLLAGLLHPTSGEIHWNNQSVYQDLPAYRQRLCYVGHKTGLSPQLTVEENCLLDWHWQRREISLEDLLSRFDLIDLVDKPCYQLSAGQRRRVALLRLAMTNAPFWLLDEPLIALDKSSIAALTSCLEQHLENKGLIVLTSHQDLPIQLKNFQVYTL